MSRVILNINTTSGNKNSDNEDKKKKNGGGGNYMNNVLDYMDEIKVGFKSYFSDLFYISLHDLEYDSIILLVLLVIHLVK